MIRVDNPGQDQTKDGKQLPEEADKDEPKPREPSQTPASPASCGAGVRWRLMAAWPLS